MIMMLVGENFCMVVKVVDSKFEIIKISLFEGVIFEVVYDRISFVDKIIDIV